MIKLITFYLILNGCPSSITPATILALGVKESSANINAINRNDYGIFQINKLALKDFNYIKNKNYSTNDLLIFEKNLEVSVWHLCRYQASKRDLLEIYHLGYGRWKRLNQSKKLKYRYSRIILSYEKFFIFWYRIEKIEKTLQLNNEIKFWEFLIK